MNIFVIGENSCPILSAKELCNRHSSRMPLETMGMLMFAFPEGSTPSPNPYTNRHYSHPASIWLRDSKDNFEWGLIHGLAQCEEYTRRYKREHDSQKHIEWAEQNYHYLTFEKIGLTPFARCFGPFKQELDNTESDTLQAYRKFYWLDKNNFAKWPSKQMIPDWWQETSDIFVDKTFKDGIYTKR